MADKFHNDADKTVYRFHQPENANHYEEPAEDAEKTSTKSSTTKTPTKSTSTAKEK